MILEEKNRIIEDYAIKILEEKIIIKILEEYK